MITKLLPDQIAKFWPIIKYAVEESLPPTTGDHPDKMNRVLSSMLSGSTKVWVSYKHPDNKFEAVIVTKFIYDDDSGTKNLLIYCLYGYEPISQDSWTEGAIALFKYAKANRCSMIVAYTANPLVVEIAKKYGADTSYTIITIDLSKIV